MTTTIRVVPHISVVPKVIHASVAILHLVGSYAGYVAGRSRLNAAAMALDAVLSLANAPMFQRPSTALPGVRALALMASVRCGANNGPVFPWRE